MDTIDKSGGFIPAYKTSQGTVRKKGEDGVIREYNLDLSEDDSEFLLDDELENMDVGKINIGSVRQQQMKQRPKMGIEQQIQSSLDSQITKQVFNYINKVVNNPKIKIILSKNKNWINDNDYVNTIAQKVVEASGSTLMFETVKQSLKNIYGN